MDSYILAGFTAEGQYVEVKYGDDADLEAIQSWLEFDGGTWATS